MFHRAKLHIQNKEFEHLKVRSKLNDFGFVGMQNKTSIGNDFGMPFTSSSGGDTFQKYTFIQPKTHFNFRATYLFFFLLYIATF